MDLPPANTESLLELTLTELSPKLSITISLLPLACLFMSAGYILFEEDFEADFEIIEGSVTTR